MQSGYTKVSKLNVCKAFNKDVDESNLCTYDNGVSHCELDIGKSFCRFSTGWNQIPAELTLFGVFYHIDGILLMLSTIWTFSSSNRE